MQRAGAPVTAFSSIVGALSHVGHPADPAIALALQKDCGTDGLQQEGCACVRGCDTVASIGGARDKLIGRRKQPW